MSKKRANNVRQFDTRHQTPEGARHLGKTKKFTQHDLLNIKPKTESQLVFFDEYNAGKRIIANLGTTGTGKTFTALYAALNSVLDPSSEYFHIKLVRSLVEVRKNGFLPGTQEEKQEPYESVYADAAANMFTYNNPYELLKDLGYVSFESTAHLRSRTFDNTIMIIDEIQNMDRSEIFTAITRVGKHSKLILCGDGKQDDLQRHREKSGFSYLLELLSLLPEEKRATIIYDHEDIVRDDLVKDIIIADEKIP